MSAHHPDIQAPAPSSSDQMIREDFDNFILGRDHPCIMAQTVFTMDKVDFHIYENPELKETARQILKDLKNYVEGYDFDSNDFQSFIAAFRGAPDYSEEQFERMLWNLLQLLHDLDDASWDREVSSDPDNPDFSFSLAGRAFFIVGMHPNSSRKARQSPVPSIAFNLHWQFEKLREMGTFKTVRDKIRERDIELQGEINPMLKDHGEESEARQYSGRKVGEDWKCPFLHHKK